jgi:very-short-patch-repair endonuclease
VLHSGQLSLEDKHLIALKSTSPRAQLTAFTAAALWGLAGWQRHTIHLLLPNGVSVPRLTGIPVRIHRTDDMTPHRIRWESIEQSVIRAAGTLNERPACAILAAAVQQHLTTAADLRAVIERRPRLRHRQLLLAAADDIGQGSEALSEIDFVLLCRRSGLPAPLRQQLRVDSTGRRRYLDACWRRADGQLVVAEVDGALHLVAGQWWDDQFRQNELVMSGAVVLRFPSVVIRTQPEEVARQLRAALTTSAATAYQVGSV